MLAAVLGIVGLVLALFAVGGFMEGDMGKVGKFGGAFAVCAVLILMTSGPRQSIVVRHCEIDWDGFANSEVCD